MTIHPSFIASAIAESVIRYKAEMIDSLSLVSITQAAKMLDVSTETANKPRRTPQMGQGKSTHETGNTQPHSTMNPKKSAAVIQAELEFMREMYAQRRNLNCKRHAEMVGWSLVIVGIGLPIIIAIAILI